MNEIYKLVVLGDSQLMYLLINLLPGNTIEDINQEINEPDQRAKGVEREVRYHKIMR